MIRRRIAGRPRRVSRDPGGRRFPDDASLLAAWRAYKASDLTDDQLRNRLVEHYLPLVRYAAERLGAKLPEEVDVDDLMSAGIFGLVDAIGAFDPARGVKFETYCAQRIRGAILDELRSMDWVPRLVRHRAQKLDHAIRTLEVELGRMPNVDEIGRRLGLKRDQLEKLLRDAHATSIVSLSQKLGESDNNRDLAEVDVLPDERSSDPVAEAQKNDIRDFIRTHLNRAEQLIIVLYYYEQMTMKEIGATLDLSESRVSQIHSAILDRLRSELGTGEPIPTAACADPAARLQADLVA